MAPRSPMSPQHHIHPINTLIPTTNGRSSIGHRNGSSSPTVTPPPSSTPTASALLANATAHDNQRLLKIRRFLGALVQFGQDTNPDVGDRLRSLVLSLSVSSAKGVSYFSFFLMPNAFPYRVVAFQSMNSKLPYKRPPISHCAQTCCHSCARICPFYNARSTHWRALANCRRCNMCGRTKPVCSNCSTIPRSTATYSCRTRAATVPATASI